VYFSYLKILNPLLSTALFNNTLNLKSRTGRDSVVFMALPVRVLQAALWWVVL
jgi:hypothetical protein